jgi:hypothetical protein
MTRQTPFFPVKDLSIETDYIPYQNCLAYIKQKSSAIPYSGVGQAERLELMQRVGMKNYLKFHRRRFEWDKLEGQIPLAYFEGIGVNIKILSYCIELDNDAYTKALSISRKVPYVNARMGPCFYGIVTTPLSCRSEEDAVEFFHNIMLDSKAKYTHLSITFPGIIRHTFTRGEGLTGKYYYYPTFNIKSEYLMFNDKNY